MIQADETWVKVANREVKLTRLQKAYWPGPGEAFTKGDYLVYLHRVAPFMLPYYRNRPLVVTRYPEGVSGEGFYQKNVPAGAPEWLRTYRYISDKTGDATEYILLDDEAVLMWLGNQGALELHPWLSTIAAPELPDRLVIDLDPAEGATFTDVVQVALATKEILDSLGWTAFLKTSGATGLHILLNIRPVLNYRAIAGIARTIGTQVQAMLPEKVTLERAVRKRTGKVYFDYLQNGLGKTVVGPYSVRPLPGAPVSCPIRWEELREVVPGEFTMVTVPERLQKYGDPLRPLNSLESTVDLPSILRRPVHV